MNAIAPPTTRLGRGTVLLLLTGRAASRGAQYLTGLVLLAVWGPAEFARYAAPLGVAIWLFALSAAGTERAALVLIGGSGGYALERVFIWFALAPEGTRKKVKEWKSGFLRIALAANVPILPVYFHYPEKTIGLGPLFHASGDMDADMVKIREFYKPWQGRNRGTV